MKILNTTNLNEARKQIEKLRKESPNESIAILSQDDEFNRKVLEIRGLSMLIINEDLETRDYSKQRNSSLNEVLMNICKEKNISVGIQIDIIIKKSEIEKAESLARLIQNIMLAKKAGVKVILLASNKNIDKRDIQALLITLGASTKQALKGDIDF
jgi:RNase P/RNase MRP subunit p30